MGHWRIDRRTFLAGAAAAITPGPTRAEASQARAGASSALPAAHDSSFDPWIEVRADHLTENAAEVSRFAGGRPLLAVIKNNAYGLGLLPAARALASSKAVRGLAVVKLHEALDLREAGVKSPILMMGPFDARDIAEMHARDIMPMVYTPIGDVLERAAQGAGKPMTVHVKIDTGLGRVGVPYREAATLVKDLAARKGVTIGGVMMTFTEDAAFDQEQLRRFERLAADLKGAGIDIGLRHAASSYTLFQHDNALLDMVRPGMVLYGIYPEPKFRAAKRMELRTALAFRTRVLYVKQLAAGESAGYERAYVAKRDTWIATLPVGHADGWPRAAAKGAKVRIGTRLYPVIASVSASHTIIEIGADQTVRAGDIATLFDWQEGSRPEDVAAACGASVYDLTMHLGGHLSRRVV
jgi:alanine racemase